MSKSTATRAQKRSDKKSRGPFDPDAPLYRTDKRIAADLGIGYDTWLERLERAGLPKRDPDFGDRRYWPAVKAWLDRRNGIQARKLEAAAIESSRVPRRRGAARSRIMTDRDFEPEEFT